MERSEFIKLCGGACLGAVGLSAFLQSCVSAKHVTGTRSGTQLQIPTSAFLKKEKGDYTYYHAYLLTQPESYAYPIVIFRRTEVLYEAYVMRCTHQGAELAISGNLISCSAHGSEFSTSGEVLQGPATEALKKLLTENSKDQIIITLE